MPSDLSARKTSPRTFHPPVISRLVISLIRLYQKSLSYDHGWFRFYYPYGCCRFFPTCSEYAARAFEKYGFWRAAAKTAGRLIRCHPLSKGGWDPA